MKTKPPPLQRSPTGDYDFTWVRKVLIIKMSSLGDILHATPVARAIRASLPEAKIGWLTSDIFRAALEKSPLCDELLEAPKSYWRQGWRYRLANARWAYDRHRALVRAIRSGGYELALDLQENFLTAALARVAGVPYLAGFDDAREHTTLLTNVQVNCRDPGLGPRGRPICLAAGLGFHAPDPSMEFTVAAEDREGALALLRAKGIGDDDPFAVLLPATSWQSKCWLSERFAELGERLVRERGLRVVVLGGSGDRGYVERVQEKMKEPAASVIGEASLRECGALLERARACVGGDTGPLYIAIARGTPSVGLFGPSTSVGMVMPGERVRIVHHADQCRCYLTKRRFCPDQPCMQATTVEEVFQAVTELLDQAAAGGGGAAGMTPLHGGS